MRRILKYLLAGTLAAVILVAIVIILILGSRWLTASEVARQKIISETVRLTGGDLNYEKLTLHLLPLPHLTALQVKFQIPGKVSLEAAALAIYPDMTALIRGTLRFKDVVIVQPAARVVMPRTTVADAMPSKTFSFGGLKEAGAAIFAALARLGPDLKIKVKDGAVDLVRADKPVLQIARIAMGVDSHEQIVTLDLSCWSQVSGWLKFKGTLDLGTRDSDGRLKLEALDVRALPTKLPPLAGIRFSDTRLGLEVIFNTRAAEKIQARVACNIPQVRLIRHKKNLVLRNALLKGDFTVDAQKLSWDINSIKIDSMDLDLDSEGTLIFGSQSSPAALELKAAGWHINVAAVARSFKKLAGDLAWVQSAFSVAREGVLTKTTCRLVARQTGSGWIVPEIQATGRLDRGLISIPGADLDLADLSGDVILENQRVDFKLMQGRLPYGIFEQLDARIDWQQAAILQVSAPRATVRLEEFYPWLVTFENLQELRQYVSAATGELAFTQLEIDGPLTLPADWQMAMAATVRDVTISVPDISGPLHLSQGVVGLKQKALVFEKVRVQYLDADTVTSGKIQGKPGQLELLRLLLDGALGEQAIAGFHRLMALPEYLRVQPALQIAKMDLQWDARDSATVVGEITAGGGTRLSIDAAWAPERWQIHRFELKDVFSSISLRLTRSGARVDLDYSGKLHKATLDHFLKENNTLKGWVDGKLMASGDMNDLRSLQVTGVLRGEGLSLQPWVLSPIAVERFALDCRGKSARLESADLIVAGTPMRLKGTAGMEARAYIFDLDLAVDSLNAAALNKIRDEVTSRAKKPETDEKKLLPVSGVIRLKTPRFTFKEYTLSPLHADIAIRSDTVEAVVTRAELCGISTPGTITIKPEGLQVSFKPTAVEKDLQATWECLQTRPLRADSRYSLSGIIETSGPAADLVRNLRGDLAFASDDGLIHRSNILTKIFSLLNITEIFAGKTSGLGENGFGYNAIRAHATVKAGALNFDQILVDGHAMKISGEGTVNLVEEKMAVNLLVAPLKMFDRLIKRIPVVGYITGGSVLSVPVKVKGATADPQVGLVPPAAVGRGLVGILERILKAPLEVVTSLPGVNGLKTPPTAPEAGKSGPASD